MTMLRERSTTTDAGAMPREFHWTAKAFYQAAGLGVFKEPNQLELVYGRIIRKMPQSPVHTAVRRRVARRLREMVSPSLCVCEENPIHIAFDGEPVPDVVMLRGPESDYDERHPMPEDVRLIVEVAVSSVASDTGDKAMLYAQAGIADYWVVLPDARQIVVHRDPTPQGYASVTTLGMGQTVSPLAASDVTLAVADLLGKEQGR